MVDAAHVECILLLFGLLSIRVQILTDQPNHDLDCFTVVVCITKVAQWWYIHIHNTLITVFRLGEMVVLYVLQVFFAMNERVKRTEERN